MKNKNIGYTEDRMDDIPSRDILSKVSHKWHSVARYLVQSVARTRSRDILSVDIKGLKREHHLISFLYRNVQKNDAVDNFVYKKRAVSHLRVHQAER